MPLLRKASGSGGYQLPCMERAVEGNALHEGSEPHVNAAGSGAMRKRTSNFLAVSPKP